MPNRGPRHASAGAGLRDDGGRRNIEVMNQELLVVFRDNVIDYIAMPRHLVLASPVAHAACADEWLLWPVGGFDEGESRDAGGQDLRQNGLHSI